MDVLLLVQSQGFQALSDMISSRRTESLSSDDAVAFSQTQQLLSDPHYLKLLDGLIEECNKMKSIHEMFRDFYEPEGHNNDVVENEPAEDLNLNRSEDDVNGKGKSVLMNRSEDDAGPSVANASRRIVRGNKSFCSLDCGPVGVDVPFLTLFLRANARIFKNLPKLHLEILDYCLLKDDSMMRKLSVIFYDNYILYVFFLYFFV